MKRATPAVPGSRVAATLALLGALTLFVPFLGHSHEILSAGTTITSTDETKSARVGACLACRASDQRAHLSVIFESGPGPVVAHFGPVLPSISPRNGYSSIRSTRGPPALSLA
ncbi:MAG TPA: hypothetical protein VM557_03305 [Thermoanaerobaculia bacterium]|nr:hypothetical protein [Thermoanaerobaculia bacterium]